MGVLFEAFYQRGIKGVPTPEDGDLIDAWWDHLAKQANELSKVGFTAVWLPPVTKARFGRDAVGYSVFDDYDLGSKNQKGSIGTRYGTREQLARCVAIMRANGLDVYLDLVPHQRDGGSGLAHHTFRYADADGNIGGGRFPKDSSHFYPGSSEESYVPNSPSLGADLKIVKDPTHYVFNNLIDNADWVTRALDVQGYRVDDAAGLSKDFVFPLLTSKAMATKFAVAEFWTTEVGQLAPWLFDMDKMRGRCSAFDFPAQHTLQRMCNRSPGFKMSELDKVGLAGHASLNAVTFVENHDTDANPEGSDKIFHNKMLGYAFILTSVGYPCVFYKDYSTDAFCFGLKPLIDKLLFIHEKIAAGLSLRRAAADNVFVYERMDGPHLLVGLNNDEVNPQVITVDTGFGARVRLHDYTGHGPDLQTDGNGRATMEIRKNADGLGYVCYSRPGIDETFTLETHSVTQAFEGAQDLDIKPADPRQFVDAARVWCQHGTPLRGTLRQFDTKDWTETTAIALQVIDPNGEMLTSGSFDRTTPQGEAILATTKITGFHLFQIRSFETPETNQKPGYTLEVTYQAPKELV
jgi:alpha-amylase